MTGSKSGEHLGRLVAHSDGRGVSFDPDAPFAEGEDVTVHSTLPIRGADKGAYGFTIARSAPGYGLNQVSAPTPTGAPGDVSTYASRPDLKPAAVAVGKHAASTAAGDIFLTPNPSLGQKSAAQHGPMIVDGNGNLVWFDPIATGVAANLSVQRYFGKRVLSWFQGKMSTAGYGDGVFEIEDASYRKVAEIHAGNGYAADVHDFVITPQNTALLLAYNPVVPPASLLDGGSSRVVLDAIVQEIDIRTGSVIFEWHSLGNIGLPESYLPVPTTTTEPYDYVHPNSIALDNDGSLLLSARHTSTVYKIDRVTGALEWRLGGKRSNFVFEPGATFTWQHDARAHAGGEVSVFDNAAREPGVAARGESRGLLLRVDEQTHTASLVQSDASPQHQLSYSQGDMQALPNGDWFAGWGSVGEYTEFAPDGAMLSDANIRAGMASYRALKFQWIGTPTDPPRIAVTREGPLLRIAASWNGATNVARWQVLVGPDPHSLHAEGTFDRIGFETAMRVPDAHAGVVEVRALDAAGRTLGTSAPRALH